VKGWSGWAIAALLFAVLATANSGGYRYGASDQAFYGPALAKAVEPALFPRDAAVLAPQMRLWLGDEVYAAIARTLGLDQPPLFAAIYVLTLAVLFVGAVSLTRALGGSWLAALACLALFTLRHRIAKTGANSLEGYMHPRMLAFGLGLSALAYVLRRKWTAAIVLVVVAGIVHPTTALWFGIVVGLAAVTTLRTLRPILFALFAAGAASVVLLLFWPAGRLPRMDAAWLGVLAEKDYLFPGEWPLYAWLMNTAYLFVLIAILRRRAVAGSLALTPGERRLAFGWIVLFYIFLVSVPLTQARLALAVQLQVTRVFWLFDAITAAYLAWWLVDHVAGRGRRRLQIAIVAAIAVVSAARGAYVLGVETHRPLVQYDLPADDWTAAMRWLRTQPVDWYVLADPGHAWKYGSSVRLAARRDTLLESGKDTSMAMYDRDVAMRVRDRSAALVNFDSLTADAARAFATHFDLDVLVSEASRPVALPVLYRNTRFVIYDLR
jgi:hypothetical protein